MKWKLTGYRAAIAAATTSVALLTGAAAGAEKTELRAISSWPSQFILTEEFIKLIEEINSDEDAPVSIAYQGGPEVIPSNQQGNAIRNGAYDMLMGPPGYYLGLAPEGNVLFGSNVTPARARENGGLDLLNEFFAERINSRILGWGSGDVGFSIFLKDEPKRTEDGGIDLSGVKLRSAPPYKDWLTSLGATNVMMPSGEAYTALERGIVDGFAWSDIGYTDTGLHEFVKYKIAPSVWSLDVVIAINLDAWSKLGPEAQEYLAQAGIAYEANTAASYSARAAKEEAMLVEAGGAILELEGAARDAYVQNAHSINWNWLKEKASENYDALRAKFYE